MYGFNERPLNKKYILCKVISKSIFCPILSVLPDLVVFNDHGLFNISIH